MHKTSEFEQFLTNLVSTEPKILTSRGKEVSHYTMVCQWKEIKEIKYKKNPDGSFKLDKFGNKILDDCFTYRGDHELTKLKASGKYPHSLNQLQALLIKYTFIRDRFTLCKIYNNHKPPMQSLIFHETNEIHTNTILNELKELQ